MKFVLAILAALVATPSFSSETTNLYSNGMWAVDRVTDETGPTCFISTSDANGKLNFAFAEFRGNFQMMAFNYAYATPPKTQVTIHFTGLRDVEDTFLLNVTRKAEKRISIATDSYDFKTLIATALGMEITYGDNKIFFPLNGGYGLVPTYNSCVEANQ